MKLINQSIKVWQQIYGEIDIYTAIEKAARLCYKSENNITENSYEKLLNTLSEKGHGSPLEHGTIYIITNNNNIIKKYIENPYSKVIQKDKNAYITSNYRVIKENNWENDLKCLCAPTEFHEKRISVHIITDRAISHELVRHRVFSFCQESQRYCSYNKDKFGNELTFIIPNWVNTHCPNDKQDGPSIADIEWSTSMMNAEASYFSLLKEGWKPQQAREVLPNSTKTELVMTGFKSDWEQFFKLRCSPFAHPMTRELANSIKDKFIELGYINYK